MMLAQGVGDKPAKVHSFRRSELPTIRTEREDERKARVSRRSYLIVVLCAATHRHRPL